MESGPSFGDAGAGEGTATGELRRSHVDHLAEAAIHLERVGGPTRRSGEMITAAVSQTFSTHHSGTGGGTSRHRAAMQPDRRAGEETAAGELRRTYADHLDAAATHLEEVGGPMRRPWERITAATSRTFSTHHSGTGGENSRRQTAMQPGKEVGPDGADDSTGERLGTIGM